MAKRAPRLRLRSKGKMGGSFKAVAKRIADKQGIPIARANAILAAGTRHASARAKRANPKLNRVH